MTADLHLSGGDTRLAGTRLIDAPQPITSRSGSKPSFEIGADRVVLTPSVGSRISREIDGDDDMLESEELPTSAGVEESSAHLALLLDEKHLDQISSLFKLLSDRTRLSIVQILCEGELNVTTLCNRLKLPQPTVSHHLGLLRMNRLIANRRAGKQVYYRLHDRVQPAAPAAGPAVRGNGELSAGVKIVDEGFAIQIAAHRHAGLHSRLEAPVLHSPS